MVGTRGWQEKFQKISGNKYPDSILYSSSLSRLSGRVQTQVVLALIHEAIAHMAGPIIKLGEASFAFERIANSLENSPGPNGAAGVLDSAPVPVAILTLDFRILSCNRAMADLLGYETSELVGRATRDFVDKRGKSFGGVNLRARLRAGNQAEWRGKIVSRNGRIRAVKSLLWPIRTRSTGRVWGCGVIDFPLDQRHLS